MSKKLQQQQLLSGKKREISIEGMKKRLEMKEPLATDPMFFLKSRGTGVKKEAYLWKYHSQANPEMM